MQHHRFKAASTPFIFATIQVMQGVGLFTMVSQLPGGAYDGLRSHSPLLASLLVGGGAILLLVARCRMTPALRQGLLAVPASAALVMTALYGQSGMWPAAIHHGALAVAILCLPYRLATEGKGPDLAAATLSAIEAGMALLWLLTPGRYGSAWLATAVVLSGAVGAVAVLMPDQWRQRLVPHLWLYRTLRMALPLLMLWWFARSGFAGEALAWAVWAVVSLLGAGGVPAAHGLAMEFHSLVQRLRASQAELEETHRALARSEARLSHMMAIAPTANIVIDASQRIILFNQMAEVIFGYTEAEALGQPLDILLPPGAVQSHRFLVAGFGQGSVSQKTMAERQDLVGRRKNGELFPIQVAISRVTVGDETFFLAVAQDVTERRATERRLKESEERFRSAFQHAPIGVGLLTQDRVWVQANRSLCEMLGYTEEEIIGRSIDDFTCPDDLVPGYLEPLIQGQVSSLQAERRFVHRDGRTVWVQQSYSAMQNQQGDLTFIIQVQDITERKRYEAELVHLANYDPLTELANRRRFRQELDQQLARCRRTGQGGALFFLDLDLFKYVNDTLGHWRGDEVLRRTAALLKEVFRPEDTIARLGGDEFAVLLPDTDRPEAIRKADELLEALRRTPVAAADAAVSLTASVGVTFFPEQGLTADELLRNADVALYEAKDKGRNAWALFAPDGAWKQEMESRLAWERRIRAALQHDRFVLHYQPILDLRRNKVTHHEVLIRMQGEDGQLIYPSSFLGVAERFGLIQQLDHWVVRNSIQFMGQRRREGRSQVLEVNLSGKTLTDPDLLPLVRSQLKSADVNPADLVFEITETAAIGDVEQAQRFIQDMKGLGCRFALDDVGAGFSSLYFLKQLPVDYIKIDGSFIRNLPNDVADQHLVRAMAMVARELGRQTIAEFVDSPETMRLIQDYGVDYAQGYLIGRPGPRLHEEAGIP